MTRIQVKKRSVKAQRQACGPFLNHNPNHHLQQRESPSELCDVHCLFLPSNSLICVYMLNIRVHLSCFLTITSRIMKYVFFFHGYLFLSVVLYSLLLNRLTSTFSYPTHS